MFWINLKIALRNLRKNKLFCLINIGGLAIGLTIFVFAGVLADYENQKDMFFENSSRIYIAGIIPGRKLSNSSQPVPYNYTALGPIIDSQMADVEATARIMHQRYVLSTGVDGNYENVAFSDPSLTKVFNFEYLYGDQSALSDPYALILTESAAIRLFGESNALDQVVSFNNEESFRVAAVIKDFPKNSSFNDRGVEIFAPIAALSTLQNFSIEGSWLNISSDNITYILLPEHLNQQWLLPQLETIYANHAPPADRELITGFYAEPLDAKEALMGVPVYMLVQLPGLLILFLACINYTNLATAQSLNRSREIGMRKTLGASQAQLVWQFLTESILVAGAAMLLAIAIIELLLPLQNNFANQDVQLNYSKTLPWLLTTTLLVGLASGIYPAWLITKTSATDALRDLVDRGKNGISLRTVLIGCQLTVSIFVLALAAIVYMQGQKVEQTSNQNFPLSEIYTLQALDSGEASINLDLLKSELAALPLVESVAFSSSTPYDTNNWNQLVSTEEGNQATNFRIIRQEVTPEFFDVYEIPFLAGRNLNENVTNDTFQRDISTTLNVVVTDRILPMIGATTSQEAINSRLYMTADNSVLKEFVIVGVISMPSFNIVEDANQKQPWFFNMGPGLDLGSIRFVKGSESEIAQEIEVVWKKIAPELPIQGRFLRDLFEDSYRDFQLVNLALVVFTCIALFLALIGLFGLAAFIAERRTKEIGVRKALGASTNQIVKLLAWKILTPVKWALLFALPAAFIVSNFFLNFFSDRINPPILILILSGALSVFLAWATIAGQAYRVARAKPITALRYE